MEPRQFLAAIFAATLIAPTATAELTKDEANQLIKTKVTEGRVFLSKQRAAELEKKLITHEGKTMPIAWKIFGEAPADGRSLYISMHGGGSAAPAVNDGQWQNQIRLYQPEEGIYLAPRAATDTWNLWHEAHIDPMFQRIIENMVVLHGVNPNKVYLNGFSAGGDGTYQLAPRMADRFAAAAMMAGHPNETKPDGLMNLPFFIQCGGQDSAYERNKIAAQWGKSLEELAKKFPGFYKNKTIIYPQYGHWMNLEDKQAFPWMAKFQRNPWPKQVIWLQDDITHQRFYWLYNAKPSVGQRIHAKVDGQTITLDSSTISAITLRLSDDLLDLDQAIKVQTADGKILFEGKVARTKKAILTSLKQRFDPPSIATATLDVVIPTK